MKIPTGMKNLVHTYPSPILIHVTGVRLKQVRGGEINFFNAGDEFVKRNNGGSHYVKNIGKKPVILHADVLSIFEMPTAKNIVLEVIQFL
ncbi:hypothetical protein [uncultured Prochlorococcus sp.]|uniref:hypothetical protein n=1 Tax=uncultured Prochlorococcus sp. TaxID=159733 RepID=UPI002590A98E|nr:hypothetical protein [uncultured Prochlorococcus sp.]